MVYSWYKKGKMTLLRIQKRYRNKEPGALRRIPGSLPQKEENSIDSLTVHIIGDEKVEWYKFGIVSQVKNDCGNPIFLCHTNFWISSEMFIKNVRDQLSRQSFFQVIGRASFFALVGFGAPAGVLAVLIPGFFYRLTRWVSCPKGSELVYQEWYEAGTTSVSMTCQNAAGEIVGERSLLAFMVYLGIFFLIFFYFALTVLLLLRASGRNTKRANLQP